ncbi:MAG: hypothetical protein KC478_09105 [Bacteriovoracaceae bacterium]|nr:hypothetical protein [Bacteriovoracaceae bacterium]
MDCHFHAVNIFCNDLQKESSFLSFLFDVEIHFDKEQTYFHLGGVRFNLLQALGSFVNPNPQFELTVSSVQDLKNFQQKFELYGYKSQGGQLKSSFSSGCFEFEDPCSNMWRLSLNAATTIQAPADTLLM